MANLLSNTTIGGYQSIHTGNIGSYAITSIPANVITTSGGQTIAGTTYFSGGESLNVYGIRGRFTNEYMHLYNKVGIGHPSGWGQGEGNTPVYGLSTYGGANFAYGNNADSTFNGIVYSTASFRAPIYYDSADTTYYFDGNSTTSLRTHGSWRADSSNWDGEYSGKIQYHSNHWYFQSGNLWIFRNAGGSNVFQVDQSGNGTFNGDIYLGTRATWLSSYLNQDVRTSASPSFSTVNLNTLNASDTNARYYVQSTNGVPSNNLGNPTVTEMALFDEQFNNKTAFYDNTALSFWTSSDGTNYTEYTGFDTTTKKRFLGGDSDSGVYIPNLTNRFRIELENTQGYVFLNQLYIYWSSNSHSTKVHIWVRRCDNNQWYQWTDSNTQVSSWPGHLYLPFGGIPFYPGALASNGHYNRIRIEFIPSWSSGTYSYTNINLMRMQIWGGYPAGKRNIYSVDENRNVTFPTEVGATAFYATDFRAANAFYLNGTSYYLNSYNGGIYTNARFETAGNLVVQGNSYLGNGNGDEVHINDILRVGATDSGDAHFYFGEGGSAGSDYGSHWYWDSGYTFTWNTRNNGTDTALFDYVTNDTTYLNWRRNFHMQNREINFASQLHFNGGTRFVTNDTHYLNFKTDATDFGSIAVRDGNNTLKGYLGYFDANGFGLLNSSGSWGIRLNPGNGDTLLYSGGNWKLTTISAGISVNGNVYTNQNYGDGLVGVYSAERYQGVFAMGDAYKLATNGTSPGSLYGIAWTHTNVGGQSKSGLGHQALFMMNGQTYTAIGSGIWTDGTITTTSHGTSANWIAAYNWGNHASADYLVKGTQILSSASWPTATRFGSVGDISQEAGNHALSVRSENNNDAFMSFHIGGDYAVHFGLDRVSNRMSVGGWSDGAVKYQLWDSRDFTSSNISNWSTAYSWGNHASAGYQSASTAITTSNIGSQSVSYATTAGALSSMNISQFSNNSGYLTGITSGQVTGALGYTPYNSSNPSGYITGYTETDTLASVTGRGATTSTPITISTGSSQPLSLTTANSSPWHLALNRTDLGLTSRVFAHNSPYNGWYFEHNISIAGNTNWHSGNLTNLNQLSNGPGYITGYTETDTLNSVTGRGNTTSNSVRFGTHVDLSPTGSAFRFYDGTTFRGGFGTDAWGHSGSDANLVLYVNGDNTLFFSTAGTKRANLSSSAFNSLVALQQSGNQVLHAGNYTSYSPSLTGSGASGTWSINVTGSAGSAPNGSNSNQFYDVNAGVGNGLRFWNGSSAYKISMGVGALYQYGPVTDYSIKAQMNDGDTGRGFTWGRESYAPIAALNSTSGDMEVAGYYKSYGYRGNGNVGGTGSASWHPDGIYCGSTMWQYGTMYKNNTGIYGVSEIQLNAGLYLQTYNDRNLIVKGNSSSDAGIEGRNAAGNNVFQIYGSGSDYGFLNGTWAGWDIRKTKNAAMFMNNDSTYYLQTNSTSNFYALNIQGNAVVHAGNIGSQTVSNSNHLNSTRDTPSGKLQYWDAPGLGIDEAPSGDWHNTIRMGHGSPLSYYSNTLAIRMTGSGVGDIYTQTIMNGNRQGWKKHWNDGNHGSGSGLDADLLDGQQGSYYQPASSAITTSNIGSQSVSYASSAGSLSSMNISQFTNNSGYITGISFANVSSKPTTISGYGITDAITTGNIGSQSVSYATTAGSAPANGGNSSTVGGYSVSVGASANTIPTRNASGYLIPESWIQFNGIYGLYSPTNGAHLRPNDGSYGSWQMSGSRNGWQGIEFNSGTNGNVSMMIDTGSNTSGFHNNSYGWQIRWYNGTLYVGKNSYGGGTDATVLDSSNYSSWAQPIASAINTGNIGSQSVSYATTAGTANAVAWTNVSSRPTALSQFTNDLGNYGGWITSSGSISGSAGSVSGLTLTSSANGINPDSVTQNQIGYNTSVSLFGQSDGGLYSSAYSSSWIHQIYGDFRTGQIAIRGKNSGSWQAWRTVLDSSNYTSYAPGLTGSGASGTWGISVTGNAATVGGYAVSTSVGANTVVIRDSNGYIYAHYINSNVSESENPTINSFYTSNGDGWLRKSSVAHVKSQLGLGSLAYLSSLNELDWYGYLTSENWNTFWTSNKLRVASVSGATGIGRPPTSVHNFGSLLSYGTSSGDAFQMYFPDNAGNSIANSRKLHYRTGQSVSAGPTSSGWCDWRTVVDMVGDTLTIVEGATPKIVVRGSVSYGQPTSASIELVGDADNGQTKSYRWISTAPDWNGQDLKLERYSINNGYQLVGRVPKNTYNLEWQGTITQGLSDSRVKTNVVSMTEGLDKIDRIRPVTFDWIPTENVSDREGADFGFIAQELEEVLPEVVHTRGDGYKTVMYEKVVPVLVQAMKEQQAMIEALKAEIEFLKNK